MPSRRYKYILGLPPRPARRDEIVALDFEIFGQDGDRMHVANGTLACLSIGMEDANYIVTTVGDVRRAFAMMRGATIAMQHGLYDLRYARKFGVPDVEKLRVWDVEIADHVLHSGLYVTFGLAAIARRELDLDLDKTAREGFYTEHDLTPNELSYAAGDAQVTRTIALKQIKEMEDEELKVYWEIEHPSFMAILDIGPSRVNPQVWMGLANHHTSEYNRMTHELGFNVKSPPQVIKNVQERIGLVLPNAQAETLLSYANFDLIAAILLAKMHGTNASNFGKNWLDTNVDADGLVNADWQQCGTETDRWACKHPNLQQIPVRKSPKYRTAFIAVNKGEQIISMDADQQEPRCLAYLSHDARLMQALVDGIKTHLLVAREIFHDPALTKKQSPEKYNIGKIVNLGICYGMSPYGLAHDLHISLDESEAFVATYYSRFPGVFAQGERWKAQARAVGYIRGATGMKVWVNPHTYQMARNAMNAPIQLTAAHITKRAVGNLHRLTREADLPFGLIMGVHDELVASVLKKNMVKYRKVMDRAWAEAAEYVIPGIPFATETVIGPTWSKMEG